VYLPKLYNVEVVIDGEERSDDYDEDDANDLKFGEELPFFYNDLFKNYSSFEKINVGMLEKGDEITITYSFENTVDKKEVFASSDCVAFDAQVITYPTIYPKGSHNVSVKLGADMFFNYSAQNAGPNASLDSRLEADTVVYTFKAGQSDPVRNQYFTKRARVFATSKFEVALCPKHKPESSPLILGEAGGINEEYDENQLKSVVYNKIGEWASYSKVSKGLMTFMGEVKVKGTDDILSKYYRGFQSYVYNTGQVEGYNDNMFIGVMIDILDEYELEYDIIVGPNRESATIDDMILNSELVYGLKVKDKKEDYFIFPMTQWTTWTDKDVRLIDQEVFVYSHAKKLEDSKIDADDMPMSLAAENQINVRAKLKLGDGFTAMIVNRNTSYMGAEKTKIAPMIVTVPEYHKAMFDKKVYQNYADMRDEDAADEKKENRLAYFTTQARSLFDTVEYQRFNVKKTGFEEDEKWLQVNEKFTIPGDDAVKFQIKDSMRVYTVGMGKLINTMYPIDKANYARDGDVYIDYPKIIDFTLRFEVPTGYAVFGFDGFEIEMDTDFASLKGTTNPNGQELKVSVNLVMKKPQLSEDEWQQLATMLSKFEDLAKVQITMAGN
ncbi:MAG: hypothetical protein ACPGLV_14245, partial [Bacteroidia bacterium]